MLKAQKLADNIDALWPQHQTALIDRGGQQAAVLVEHGGYILCIELNYVDEFHVNYSVEDTASTMGPQLFSTRTTLMQKLRKALD